MEKTHFKGVYTGNLPHTRVFIFLARLLTDLLVDCVQGAMNKLGLVFSKTFARKVNKQVLSIWAKVEDFLCQQNNLGLGMEA